MLLRKQGYPTVLRESVAFHIGIPNPFHARFSFELLSGLHEFRNE